MTAQTLPAMITPVKDITRSFQVLSHSLWLVKISGMEFTGPPIVLQGEEKIPTVPAVPLVVFLSLKQRRGEQVRTCLTVTTGYRHTGRARTTPLTGTGPWQAARTGLLPAMRTRDGREATHSRMRTGSAAMLPMYGKMEIVV